MDTVEYDNCRAAFRNLLDPADGELLERLPGRQKYCSACLRPLPFDGVSVTHAIGHRNAQESGLLAVYERVASRMTTAGLSRMIAWVSTRSFHVTTFDLVNRAEHSARLRDAGYEYGKVKAAVTGAAVAFVRGSMPLDETATGAGVEAVCPQFLKVRLALNDDALARIQAFRRRLNEYLCENAVGYSIIRNRSWDPALSAHITLGYFVNPLQEGEVEALLSCLQDLNHNLPALRFRLTLGQVMRFADMDHYRAYQERRPPPAHARAMRRSSDAHA
jgi:hypothetical protein